MPVPARAQAQLGQDPPHHVVAVQHDLPCSTTPDHRGGVPGTTPGRRPGRGPPAPPPRCPPGKSTRVRCAPRPAKSGSGHDYPHPCSRSCPPAGHIPASRGSSPARPGPTVAAGNARGAHHASLGRGSERCHRHPSCPPAPGTGTRSSAPTAHRRKAGRLRALGAEPIALDLLDAGAVRAAPSLETRPDAIIHEATALANVRLRPQPRPQLRARPTGCGRRAPTRSWLPPARPACAARRPELRRLRYARRAGRSRPRTIRSTRPRRRARVQTVAAMRHVDQAVTGAAGSPCATAASTALLTTA